MTRNTQKGFTIIELVVVAVLFITISAFVTTNLIGAQHNASLSTAMSTLVADIKNQQSEAMAGENSLGTGPNYYGIHFDTNSYTLFSGSTYNPSDPNNQTINLDPEFQFTNISLPGVNKDDLIFIPVNGEVSGYSNSTNSVTLFDTVGKEQKVLQFNYLGVITSD